MNYKIYLTSLFTFFALLPAFNASSMTRDVYQYNQGLKQLFWSRFINWYTINSNRSHEIKKVLKESSISLPLEKNRSLSLIFSNDELQVHEIKEIFLEKSPAEKITKICVFRSISDQRLEEHCPAGIKSWQRSTCPEKLEYSKQIFHFKSEDRCFSYKDDNIVLSDETKREFYSGVWPKIFQSFSSEFSYYPKGIYWKGEPLVVKLYYW